MRHASAGN